MKERYSDGSAEDLGASYEQTDIIQLHVAERCMSIWQVRALHDPRQRENALQSGIELPRGAKANEGLGVSTAQSPGRGRSAHTIRRSKCRPMNLNVDEKWMRY